MTTPCEILIGDKSKLRSALGNCLLHGWDKSIPLESLLTCFSYFQTCRQIDVIKKTMREVNMHSKNEN